MSTNRVKSHFQSVPQPPAMPDGMPQGFVAGGFAFCFFPSVNPMAMMLQLTAQQQAQHAVDERAKREEWQQIMAKCGIDYQI